jgi:hypothetical protein
MTHPVHEFKTISLEPFQAQKAPTFGLVLWPICFTKLHRPRNLRAISFPRTAVKGASYFLHRKQYQHQQVVRHPNQFAINNKKICLTLY